MTWDMLKVYAMDDQYHQYKWFKKLPAKDKALVNDLRAAQIE